MSALEDDINARAMLRQLRVETIIIACAWLRAMDHEELSCEMRDQFCDQYEISPELWDHEVSRIQTMSRLNGWEELKYG